MFLSNKSSNNIENLGQETNVINGRNIFDTKEEKQLLGRIDAASLDDMDRIIYDFETANNYNKKIIEAIIDKFSDSIWRENFNLSDKFILYNNFFYDYFHKYEEFVINKLDLKCENSLQNVRYLEFIDDIHRYSEDYWHDAPKEMVKIIEHLAQTADNENSSYFLSLKAKEILERIKKPAYDSYEDKLARWEEEEQRAKEKYGEKWEEFMERNYNNELENLPERTCIGDSIDEQVPFIIAPKVFAISRPDYFLISKSEDFADVSRLVKKYKKALNETMVLSNREEGEYRLNNEAVDRADSIEAELEHYFRKRLTVEDMTIPHEAGEKTTEIKKQNFRSYRFMVSPWFTKKIKDELGIDLPRLDFRSQFYFLFLANRQTNRDFAEYKKYLQSDKNVINRVKVLLTLEIDLQNSEKVKEISNKLGQKNADKIFSKIAELVDSVENNLSDLTVNEEKIDAEKVRLELLKRAHQIIQDFSGEEKDVDKLLEDLESSKVEIALLSSLLKVAKESGVKLTPENIRGMRMERIEAGELSGGRKEEFREKYEDAVMKMMRKSYEKIFKDNPQAQEKVEENFKVRFENLEKYRVYLLMFQNEAAAFSVINPDDERCEPGEVMSESTVVHPDAQKGSLGIAFLKKIFAQEFERPGVNAIRGQVRVGHPAGKCYDAIGLRVDPSRPKFTEEGVEYEWRAARKENSQSPGNFKSAV